jgi:DNA-binding transcriptional LysR family regulator
MNKLADMSTFVAVVEAGSLTEAARRMGTTKSVVSERIRQLESRLGTGLVERAGKLRVTDAGRDFYARCVAILSDVAAAEEALQPRDSDLSGPLRLAAPLAFNVRYLGPILAQFAKAHPRICLDVETDDRFVNLQEENFELAIRIGELPDSALVARPIAPNRKLICASPSYLAERGIPQHPTELLDHDGLLYTYRESNGTWQLPVDGEMQSFRIRTKMRTDNGYQLLDAARAGLGLVILPAFLAADAIAAGELLPVLNDFAPAGGQVSAVFRQSKRGSPKIHSLVKFIAERLGQPPLWELAIRDKLDAHALAFAKPHARFDDAALSGAAAGRTPASLFATPLQ